VLRAWPLARHYWEVVELLRGGAGWEVLRSLRPRREERKPVLLSACSLSLPGYEVSGFAPP
jgi:hypothetical protein